MFIVINHLNEWNGWYSIIDICKWDKISMSLQLFYNDSDMVYASGKKKGQT